MIIYSRVKLLTNNYINEGAKINDIGFIIEVYNTGDCEVKFSDSKTGISYAQIVTRPEELEMLE